MAIVINGSGTVTGLAVGGLPDGTVDAGTLATNSVDSAELIDGSIDTAHIAADQITGAILPAGSVLQVVSTYSESSTTITTTGSWVTTGFALAITPSATSSKILIQVCGSQYQDINDQTAGATIFRDSTNIGHADHGFMPIYFSWGTAGSQDLQAACSATYLDSPSTTSAVTYTVYAKTDKNTYRWNGLRNGRATITLMEIAG